MKLPYQIVLTIFILSFLKPFCGELKAQDYYNGDLRFGLGIGPNLSWFSPKTDVFKRDGVRPGWSWGLNMDYFFGENYAFSTGISMLNYGGKLSYPDLYTNELRQEFRVTGETKANFYAVQVPIAIKMRTSLASAFNFYAKFGTNLCLNYTRTQDYYTDPNSSIDVEQNDLEFKNDSRLLNFGMIVGGGVEYNLVGRTTATAGITFNQGLINQLNKRAYLLDDSGNVAPTEESTTGPSGEKQRATINVISLDLGIFF